MSVVINKQLHVLLYCALILLYAEARQSYTVPCDHTTDACECPSSFNGVKVDVCAFSLRIQRLQTFTRYVVDSDDGRVGIRRHGGKVWYVNETTGEFQPFPDEQNTCTGPLMDTSCTEPIPGDGKAYRPLITINGRFPGPTLIVNYNQTLLINVTNLLLSETITVHWHGLTQAGTNWMDGVKMLTQCGILPGTTFTYIFQADPPGTYWYHSHAGSQRTDGLYGGLIIRETEEVMNVAQEAYGPFTDLPHLHTLTFLDYQAIDTYQLYLLIHQNTEEYNTDRSPNPAHYKTTSFSHSLDGAEVGIAPYWSGVINGRGRHSNTTYNKTRLSIFTVSPSSVYRLRLIGVQNFHPYRVSVDEHKMVVVATDGAFLEPMEVDYLIIWPGERYDVLVHTKHTSDLSSKSNFVIRGDTLETNDPIKPGEPRLPLKGHVIEAILHYDICPVPVPTQYEDIVNRSVPVETRCTAGKPCTVLNCPFKFYPPVYNLTCHFIHELSLLVPLPGEELPDVKPDERLFLNFGFEGTHQTSSINARNLVLPSSPLSILNSSELSVMEEQEYCKGLDDPAVCGNAIDSLLARDCQCTHVRSLEYNSSVQMVLSGVSPNPSYHDTYKSTHPVHMHGHQFQVLDIGHGEYTPDGLLRWPSQDITCNGATKACTKPSWAEGREYDRGKTGRVRANAPLKDSIAVPSGGYVVVYFLSSNPGFWFLHCHVDMHQIAGMEVIIGEAVDRITGPPPGMKQCGQFATTRGGHHCSGTTCSGSVHVAGGTCGVVWYGVKVLVLLAAACVVMMTVICCRTRLRAYCTQVLMQYA